MSETTTPVTTPTTNKPAADPSVFKILDDGTVLYKTYQQAQDAKQLKSSRQAGNTTKKLSQAKYGENYRTKDGKVVPYTLASLVEFQFTGLIVVIIVLAGLSLICAAIGRLIKALDKGVVKSPAVSTVATELPSPAPAPAYGIHPGLNDQQLVVLLTAAASEAIGSPVRIEKFRAINKGGNWSAQGRSELQSHRLK